MTDLIVKKLNSWSAQRMSVKNHYLHRECPCTVAYGLHKDGNVVGLCIYGCPSSSTLKRGICGDDESEHVIELKRLWVSDDIGNYPESTLIGQSLKMLKKDVPDKDIVISYADAGYGHTGIIYQATNWIYTGTSAQFKDKVLKGDTRDHLTQADELKAKYGSFQNAVKILGEDAFEYKDRSVKHRYIFFNGQSRKRNRELKSKLMYDILPYPKTDAPCIHINSVIIDGQRTLEGF